MTEQTGDVLADIDAALEGWHGHDFSLGPDAMRWAPEPPGRSAPSQIEDDLLRMYRRVLDVQTALPAEPGTTFSSQPRSTRGCRVDLVILDEPMRLHTSAQAASPSFRHGDPPARLSAEQASRLFGIPLPMLISPEVPESAVAIISDPPNG